MRRIGRPRNRIAVCGTHVLRLARCIIGRLELGFSLAATYLVSPLYELGQTQSKSSVDQEFAVSVPNHDNILLT